MYLIWMNKHFQFSRSSHFNVVLDVVPELKVVSHSSLYFLLICIKIRTGISALAEMFYWPDLFECAIILRWKTNSGLGSLKPQIAELWESTGESVLFVSFFFFFSIYYYLLYSCILLYAFAIPLFFLRPSFDQCPKRDTRLDGSWDCCSDLVHIRVNKHMCICLQVLTYLLSSAKKSEGKC